MKNEYATTVAVVAVLLVTTGSLSYALFTFQSTITNNSDLDLTIFIGQIVGSNVFQVLRNTAVTITYNLLSALFGVPWVITGTTGGLLRQLTLPIVPLGANITVAANFDVFVNGLNVGPLT